MKKLDSPTILCLKSNRWASLLGREFGDREKLRWALDINDMIFEAKPCPGAACIVELDSQSVDFPAQCRQLAEFSNNPFAARLFAVGDCGLIHWKPALRQAGVAMVCTSVLELKALIQGIRKHHGEVLENLVSIETWTEQHLPWSIN